MKAFKSSHSSILAGIIPRTEKPGRLQSIGLQRVVHDWTYKQNKKAKQSWEMAETRSDPKCSYLKNSFSSLRISVQPWIFHSKLLRHGQWSVRPWCSDLNIRRRNHSLNSTPAWIRAPQVVPASVSPGNAAEMEILRPHLDLLPWKISGVGAPWLCFNKLSRRLHFKPK